MWLQAEPGGCGWDRSRVLGRFCRVGVSGWKHRSRPSDVPSKMVAFTSITAFTHKQTTQPACKGEEEVVCETASTKRSSSVVMKVQVMVGEKPPDCFKYMETFIF